MMKHAPHVALLLLVVALTLGTARGLDAPSSPTGELVIAWHVTITPAWLDPAEAPPSASTFELYYALHDAMVRPLPGEKLGHSLAESWTESPDGLVYEFKLREGLRFHNGDPCTAEDVKFSFERYRGMGATPLHAHVHAVEVVDALRVRFHLQAPWPDFLTFYGTPASAAGFVLPKRYLEQVGEDGFKHHPIGLGPYKFVRYTPGVEVVLEAYEGHWRQVPSVKRVIMKGVPEGSTRLAMLKRQEADIAFALEGLLAEEVKRDPNLRLVDVRLPSLFWIEFPEQWEPTSVWADTRVRLAVNYALDRQAINEAACLGYCPPAGVIIPRQMDDALQVEPPAYDPQKARQLLAEAGYPHGFDAGEFVPVPPHVVLAEAVVNNLHAVGIRVQLRTMERASFLTAWREKKLRGLFLTSSGAAGNAATRVETFVYSKGDYAYGGYPDIDALFQQQAVERDPATRAGLLHRLQQLTVDRVMFAPVMDNRVLHGVGPRIAEHTLHSIPSHSFFSFEAIRLKGP
jgi:peptide/nickel transport system substrate-binding protein